MIEDSDSITLLTNNKRKVTFSFDLSVSRMCPIDCVFDTGAGIKLLRELLGNPTGCRRYAPETTPN